MVCYKYRGCFDIPSRQNSVAVVGGNGSFERCFEEAVAKGSRFSDLTSGGMCYSGNSATPPMDRLTQDYECNQPCPHDSSKMCGGYQRVGIYELSVLGQVKGNTNDINSCEK